MGISGRVNPLPGSSKASKRKAPPNTEATRLKAELDEAKLAYGKKRFAEISTALNNPAQRDPDPPRLEPALEQEVQQEIPDPQPIPECFLPLTLTQLITDDTYKHQRLQEDAQWKLIMQSVFVAFMHGTQRTSQWGNVDNWNFDFNDPLLCSCPKGKKYTRAVDALDILYRSKLNVEFCSCIPNQVRLINIGYLGGTPTRPETAFSLRLLRLYHLAWQYCHANIQPFSLMIDAYLDAFNPPILVSGTHEPRLWRQPLTSAIICYRQILEAIEELESRSLELTPLQKLAANCPRCFGPAGAMGIQSGPQYVVCVDAVAQWEPKALANGAIKDDLDPCTQQHTAAADKRNASSWRGCEETGLIGMACRHDHMIKMVNVIRSGEKLANLLLIISYKAGLIIPIIE
ncbi:hypothetical protein DFH28DRAFT_902224 [Melampsora americana]|nr:hypothetical protein DFH28DRAFT_902224 [Melampsora americana]